MTQTPTLAGQKATRAEALELNTLSVIGVLDASRGAAALLRSARGQIARVRVGESAFGLQVTAIGDDQVLLTDRRGQTVALALPAS